MVSVIIPLYNKEKCIERTINSVLQQTYSDFELIIVDDGSTDKSSEIVKAIPDNRIKYVYKQNGGVSSARNFGVRLAKYDWIFFIDADDILLENAIESLCECAEQYGKVQVVVGGCIIQNGNKNEHIIPPKRQILKKPLRNWWLNRIFPRTGNLLISKNVFNSLGGFDERLSFNEDYGFLLRMLSTYEIACCPYVTMIYTDDSKTLSLRRTPIKTEFGNYLSSLSLENSWVNYFLYRQYVWTIQRRRALGDNENADRLKKELNERFSLSKKLRNIILVKLSALYQKIILSLKRKAIEK